MVDTLFVCWANVQRSQVAEGLYNGYLGLGRSGSCAGVEARKGKYGGRPEATVTEILLGDGVDISGQEINYIADFDGAELGKIKRVIFLYNPMEKEQIDEECLIDGKSVYEYFADRDSVDIVIHEIDDPYNAGIDEIMRIYRQLDEFIKSLV